MSGLIKEIIQDRLAETQERPLKLASKDVISTTTTHHDHTRSQTVSLSPDDLKKASDPQHALTLLRSELDTNSLVRILELLTLTNNDQSNFSLHDPGALQAQIVNVLVDTTLPNFWPVLQTRERQTLVDSLRSISGVNALLAALRQAWIVARAKKDADSTIIIKLLLEVLSAIFENENLLSAIWQSTARSVKDANQQKMIWREAISLFASGKVIAVVAQAEDALREKEQALTPGWLANGALYARWLGNALAEMLLDPNNVAMITASAQLLPKALSLGYSNPLMKAFVGTLIRSDETVLSQALRVFLDRTSMSTIPQLVEQVLYWLSTSAPSPENESSHDPKDIIEVSSIAALLHLWSRSSQAVLDHFTNFLSDPLKSSSVSFIVRRSMLLVLSEDSSERADVLLDKLMSLFGDRAFLRHSPIKQQEAVAQSLLMCAGYVHRKAPMAVLVTARSSSHMQGISNRLDTSNSRARWLGMIVGTAISILVDQPGKQMKFGTEDMESKEADWYKSLVTLQDSIGQLADFKKLLQSQDSVLRRPRPRHAPQEKLPIVDGKQTFGPPRPPAMLPKELQGERVIELDDDEIDPDDDLKPYAKPDSDPEDSDEDATLVNRNKARAPVYIRDLMRMLKDDKDHDSFQMGMKHAAKLIRRKANFGTEVKDHAEEIALMLCSLQDPFATEDFDELRLQALIAVLLSNVNILAPWLARQVFDGDYSLAQRCLMLNALGLGGRELAGFRMEDSLNPELLKSADTFPSKLLTGRMHDIYSPRGLSTRRLTAATSAITSQIMQPLALSAADASTAHLNAVKVRNFSSRLDPSRSQRKAPRNQLSKIFASTFFFPLVSRFQQDIAAYGSGSLIMSTPFVLVTYLKTVALLLHASSVATLDLADVSTAFWDLLLSLRVKASQDMSVLEAVLFGLLTMLETNGLSARRLARENAVQIAATQEWSEIVFDRMGGGELSTDGSEDEKRIRMLVAGVLVKLREIVTEAQVV